LKGKNTLIPHKPLRHKFSYISHSVKLFSSLSHSLFLFVCFKNSFWYSDQVTADELIEEHKELRHVLASRANQLCYQYFCNSDTERVNKIIQIFLQHKMRQNAVGIIKLYLAYECWRENKPQAVEIVNLCIRLNIELSDNENNKFLNLLLGRSSRLSSSSSSSEKEVAPQNEQKTTKKIDIEKYKFKF
jgi:hypothetical protein